MQLTPITFDSVEQNLLWSALALQAGNYAPKETRLNATPVPPYVVAITPLVDGANEGKLFARISANIELDKDLAFGNSPVALAALPESSADTVPAHLLAGLTIASGSGGGSTLYSLPVTDAELFFRAESHVLNGFYLSSLTDQSNNSNDSTFLDQSEFQLIGVDAKKLLAPVYNNGSQSIANLGTGTATLQEWTVFFTFAAPATNGGYLNIIEGTNDAKLYLTETSLEVELTDTVETQYLSLASPAYDGDLHLYIFTMDATGYGLYVDGILHDSGTWPNAYTSFQWTKILTEYDNQFHFGDLVVLGRKSSVSELNLISDAIANYRGIATVAIS